jgi:hypothetical protein
MIWWLKERPAEATPCRRSISADIKLGRHGVARWSDRKRAGINAVDSASNSYV